MLATIVIRLLFSVMLGSVIGLEREINNHPAGFRTHVLVCVGASLFTLLSITAFDNSDSARVAAQIVSGIGFLGAGTIMREGTSIRGLTTAASLWAVAGVGMAVGSGQYIAALLTAALIVVVLWLFNNLELRLLQRQYFYLSLVISDEPGQLARVSAALGEMGVSIKSIQIAQKAEERAQLDIGIKIPAPLNIQDMINRLTEIEGVFTIKFEEN
ncbi:MAG: MgtC/SapB family protein [Firmicutes bacterium]|nr:MgtC/SapB family protein [Bacillota bacterium]